MFNSLFSVKGSGGVFISLLLVNWNKSIARGQSGEMQKNKGITRILWGRRGKGRVSKLHKSTWRGLLIVAHIEILFISNFLANIAQVAGQPHPELSCMSLNSVWKSVTVRDVLLPGNWHNCVRSEVMHTGKNKQLSILLIFISLLFSASGHQILAWVPAHPVHWQVPPLHTVSISAPASPHLDENKIERQLEAAKQCHDTNRW